MRIAVFAGSAGLLIALSAITGFGLATRETPAALIVAHLAFFVVCGLIWVSALQAPLRHPTLLLLVLALAARLMLLAFPVSDDVNRYLWEGHLVLSGESPYAQPAAAAPAALRDSLWEGMNHKDKLTAYPPVAQFLFAAAVWLDDGALALKLLLIAAEMLSLALIAAALKRRCLPPAHLALAAFNPVLLLGTAAEGHFDAFLVLAMLLALDARARGRDGWAWIALAFAIQIKLIAILLIPLMWRRGGWRRAWLAVFPLLIPALPFAGDLPNLIRGILAFGGTTAHNGFVHPILEAVVGDTTAASAIGFAILAAWTGWVTVREDDDARAAFMIIGGLLLLSPLTHVWYFSWIVPFLALVPQPAWLLLTGMQGFYYGAWVHFIASGEWAQPAWAWAVSWLPFALLFAATARQPALRLLARWPPPPFGPPPRCVSAIVPTRNEAKQIAECIGWLKASQGDALREIIVVDGGSTDETAVQAAEAGARVLASAPGRGVQIAAGIAVATGDALWVVHADSRPAPATAAQILGALSADGAAAGGAAGQRYDRVTLLLYVLETLNAVRSACFGISFGDQGQFIRRDALPAMGGYPAQPLMEDVEVSLRLRRVGPVLYLGRNVVASARGWRQGGQGSRVWLVLRLTAAYLLSRRRVEVASRLFDAYYPIPRK